MRLTDVVVVPLLALLGILLRLLVLKFATHTSAPSNVMPHGPDPAGKLLHDVDSTIQDTTDIPVEFTLPTFTLAIAPPEVLPLDTHMFAPS